MNESNYLTVDEKKKVQQLKDKVTKATSDHDLKKYATEIALLYEKARVRRKKEL